jgi:hypothetical protein
MVCNRDQRILEHRKDRKREWGKISIFSLFVIIPFGNVGGVGSGIGRRVFFFHLVWFFLFKGHWDGIL